MKKRSYLEYFGYLCLILALINYYGPSYGGKLGSWSVFNVAVAFLIFGIAKRNKFVKKITNNKNEN